jgi:hypothetical protein
VSVVPCTYQAEERARALLLAYLSPEQRETFQVAGHFDVVKTGCRRSLEMLFLGYPRFRVYRLSRSRYPVTLFTSPRQLARSRPKYGYCIHSHGAAPQDDELLSMKLLIEHDESQFVSTAYRFWSPDPHAQPLAEHQGVWGIIAQDAWESRDRLP